MHNHIDNFVHTSNYSCYFGSICTQIFYSNKFSHSLPLSIWKWVRWLQFYTNHFLSLCQFCMHGCNETNYFRTICMIFFYLCTLVPFDFHQNFSFSSLYHFNIEYFDFTGFMLHEFAFNMEIDDHFNLFRKDTNLTIFSFSVSFFSSCRFMKQLPNVLDILQSMPYWRNGIRAQWKRPIQQIEYFLLCDKHTKQVSLVLYLDVSLCVCFYYELKYQHKRCRRGEKQKQYYLRIFRFKR